MTNSFDDQSEFNLDLQWGETGGGCLDQAWLYLDMGGGDGGSRVKITVAYARA
jgi:hypothetical protein